MAVTEDGKLGDERLAIVFTDLVGFSDWALEAGDDLSLELLREVAEAIEPPVRRHHGEVVKRLGDGMMAVFDDPDRRSPRSSRSASASMPSRSPGTVRVCAPGCTSGHRAGSPTITSASTSTSPPGSPTARRAASSWSPATRSTSSSPTRSSARKKLMFRAKGVPSDVSAYSLKPER